MATETTTPIDGIKKGDVLVIDTDTFPKLLRAKCIFTRVTTPETVDPFQQDECDDLNGGSVRFIHAIEPLTRESIYFLAGHENAKVAFGEAAAKLRATHTIPVSGILHKGR